LCATYRREYKNFTHLLGESIDALFQRFTVVVNNMRANVDILLYDDHDRAVKLLHALDRTVWEGKVEVILESEKYTTLTVNELFSRLKSAEVDRGLTARLESPTDSHSLALIGGKVTKSNANTSSKMYSLSSLMSLPDEEFDVLGEDELALLTRRFERLHENRVNTRRTARTCFQCGKPGYFVADYPENTENKDGYWHRSSKDDKYRSRRDHKHKNKHKYERRSKKKDDDGRKARAMVGASDVDSNSVYSSSSSSSSEDEGDQCKNKKASKNLSGLSCFAGDGFCGMARSSGSKKSHQSDSDSDSEDEVGDLRNVWLIDSGCVRHMTGDKGWFSSLVPVVSRTYITFGDNGRGHVLSEGEIKVSDKVTLRRVALVQSMGFNFLSMSQLLDDGFEVLFWSGGSRILDSRGGLVCMVVPEGQVFRADFSLSSGVERCFLAGSLSELWKWHRKLGHLSFDLLSRLSKLNLVRGLPRLRFEKELVCAPCRHAKW
jgi:hypothetical protein